MQNPYFLIGGALLIAAVYFLSALAVEGATGVQTSSTETVAQLQTKYAAARNGGPKVKVLIVPGHEPGFGGTEFMGLKERDINVVIANRLAAQLKGDPRLDIIVVRDETAWNPTLAAYFASQWDAIKAFVAGKKAQTAASPASAATSAPMLQATHAAAPDDVATRLYGITKWANENGVDMAIHVHLNDAGDHTDNAPGNQSGFAVYVPDASFGNAPTSRPLGAAIASELNHYNATSSLAIENLGVTGDQELIALGAFDTASYASVLVEYAYIYESKITNPSVLPIVEKEFANSTYRGIERFFGRPVSYYDTLTLPHRFTTSPPAGATNADTYALQVALHRIGLYPPNDGLYYDCPVAGYMGDCTARAIKAFQKSKGLEQTGVLGSRTRQALNAIWGGT
jgi:N-acetylmuramoyl-L-alanine amidase